MTTQTIGEVVQVVSEDGEFNDKFEEFVQANRIPQAGTDYQVVAITGPQSSGKSTLMNAVVRYHLWLILCIPCNTTHAQELIRAWMNNFQSNDKALSVLDGPTFQ